MPLPGDWWWIVKSLSINSQWIVKAMSINRLLMGLLYFGCIGARLQAARSPGRPVSADDSLSLFTVKPEHQHINIILALMARKTKFANISREH